MKKVMKLLAAAALMAGLTAHAATVVSYEVSIEGVDQSAKEMLRDPPEIAGKLSVSTPLGTPAQVRRASEIPYTSKVETVQEDCMVTESVTKTTTLSWLVVRLSPISLMPDGKITSTVAFEIRVMGPERIGGTSAGERIPHIYEASLGGHPLTAADGELRSIAFDLAGRKFELKVKSSFTEV